MTSRSVQGAGISALKSDLSGRWIPAAPFLSPSQMQNASTSPAHTAGPWYADLVDLRIYSDDGKIAVVHQQVEPSEDSDITSANAFLLAAAPDLLRLARTFRCSCLVRIDILKDEREDCGLTEEDEDARDLNDQIEHWSELLHDCEEAIAKASS